MKKLLFPKIMLQDVYELSTEKLKKNNIKLLIFDIDNTLVSYSVPLPTKEVEDFFENLKRSGFDIAFLSNNHRSRVEMFNKSINAYHVFEGGKPLKKGFKNILNYFNTKPENTAIIGDQIFTDVLGGNRMNIFTIMVNPIEEKENVFFKVKRYLEKRVIKKYIKQLNNLN